MKLEVPNLEQEHIETTPQAQLNAEFYKFLQARNERLFEAILTAHMWLDHNQKERAMQTLSQALTA